MDKEPGLKGVFFINTFTFEDCWVLLSIGYGDRGSKLSGIISSGDILNHDVFSKEELIRGLNNLYSNGYITFLKHRYYWTDKAKNFYMANRKSNEGCIAELFRMAEIFKEQPFKKNNLNAIKITDEEYKRAILLYRIGFVS